MDKLKHKKIPLKTIGLHFLDMWDIFQGVVVLTSQKLQNQVRKEKPIRGHCVLLPPQLASYRCPPAPSVHRLPSSRKPITSPPSSAWLFFAFLGWSHSGAKADRLRREGGTHRKVQAALPELMSKHRLYLFLLRQSRDFFLFSLNSGVGKHAKQKSSVLTGQWHLSANPCRLFVQAQWVSLRCHFVELESKSCFNPSTHWALQVAMWLQSA